MKASCCVIQIDAAIEYNCLYQKATLTIRKSVLSSTDMNLILNLTVEFNDLMVLEDSYRTHTHTHSAGSVVF